MIAQLLENHDYKPELVDRISFRKVKYDVKIEEADPSWPARFLELKERIEKALGPTAVSINHVGSTSVPGLPAKDMIDIDLEVADIDDEEAYVPALEAAGFQFLLREMHWHKHRFFVGDASNAANLHVWGPGNVEVIRHIMFREWLTEHDDDREMYAQVKRQCAEATTKAGGTGMDYNRMKEEFIRGVLERMFKAKGLL